MTGLFHFSSWDLSEDSFLLETHGGLDPLAKQNRKTDDSVELLPNRLSWFVPSASSPPHFQLLVANKKEQLLRTV